MEKGDSYNLNGLLSANIIEGYEIDNLKEYSVEIIKAQDLLIWSRFDLMAKWIYIDAVIKKVDQRWANGVYMDNIRAFSAGTFVEPGNNNKTNFNNYITTFDALIADIKERGLDSDISLIPVDKNGQIIDGAHRVSASAYFDRKVPTLRLSDKVATYLYDYKYFRRFLMNETNMGYMAIQYAHLKPNCYMACFWPVADRNIICQAEDILKEAGPIVYERDVYLSYRGLRNFMIQIYGHQEWTGSVEDRYLGVNCKVDLCFKDKTPTKTYVFEADSFDKVVRIKERIRSLFGIENHSLHISDNKAETDMMVDLLYNPNSLFFLNCADPYTYTSLWKKLSRFKSNIVQNGLDINRFIIDSSAVLEACGLREARDIDFLTDYHDDEITESQQFWKSSEEFEKHDSQLKYYSVGVRDMLYIPENYFYYNGFKFLSVSLLEEMKRRRHERKDLADIKLCREYGRRNRGIPTQYRQETLNRIHEYQIKKGDYGRGPISYSEFRKEAFRDKIYCLPHLARNRIDSVGKLYKEYCTEKKRQRWITDQRKRLKNRDFSIIASNCNGGVLCSDLGVAFNSPFVNLFLRADDYIKLLGDLRGYLSEKLRFVNEIDPIYGLITYPTAYLRDIKIYFMHYKSEDEAREAWERRKARINWDNIYIMFTDRSGCTQQDLEMFDSLPYDNKVVFTHVPHPDIQSSFYIRGYEEKDKVGYLTQYEDEQYPVKRKYDEFDFVAWLNRGHDN